MATKKPKGGVIEEINRKLAASKKKGDIDVKVTALADGFELSAEEVAKQHGRRPKPMVQQELIEDARQTKRIPSKLRNLLGPLCEAEELAGSNRLRATELLGQIQTHMAELEIPQIALPNGGKVVYTEKKAARYVAPPKDKVSAGGGGEDSGSGDDK